MFHPLYLAISLPIHHYGIHNSGGPLKVAPTVVEAAEGRLHNGGWEEKWLDKVDETFLKAFAIVSNTFHQLDLAICHHRRGGGHPPPQGTAAAGGVYPPHSAAAAAAAGGADPPPALICVPLRPNAFL